MSEYREFWIGLDENDFPRWLSVHENFAFIGTDGHACKENVHAIEYSAFEALREKLRIAMECLEKLHKGECSCKDYSCETQTGDALENIRGGE